MQDRHAPEVQLAGADIVLVDEAGAAAEAAAIVGSGKMRLALDGVAGDATAPSHLRIQAPEGREWQAHACACTDQGTTFRPSRASRSRSHVWAGSASLRSCHTARTSTGLEG